LGTSFLILNVSSDFESWRLQTIFFTKSKQQDPKNPSTEEREIESKASGDAFVLTLWLLGVGMYPSCQFDVFLLVNSNTIHLVRYFFLRIKGNI